MKMGVRSEHEKNARLKRDYITVWSGVFCEVFEADGVSLPKANGYMLTTYNGDNVRVDCPSPRTEDNYLLVDKAVIDALNSHYKK